MRAQRLLSLAVVAALAACNGDDDDGPTPIPYTDDGKLTVMSRNLYLGAELNDIIAATSTAELRAATTAAWEQTQANDFGARAQALADEVAETLPDVIGLQEVSLWRIQVPGDFGTALSRPAETVAIDHLGILREALRQRGLSYVVAAEIELFDQEVPINAQIATDVRLTDRQVILAREGVPFSRQRAAVFAERACAPGIDVPPGCLLPLTILGQPVLVKRGWTAVDVDLGGRTITVFNTHLEAFNAGPRIAQAAELVTLVGADAAVGDVVLVGDLNSRPTDVGDSYQVIRGLIPQLGDAWTSAGSGEGFSCCFAPLLSEPRSTRDLDQRIDYVLWSGNLEPEPGSVLLVGADDTDRTPSGLWPSDHAGVVATFTLATAP